MVLHGIQRLTLDLDIAVSPDQMNLRRFIATLNQLKFIPRAPVPAETILHRERIERINPGEECLGLHLLVPW